MTDYKTWRERLSPLIASVIEANKTAGLKTIRKALRDKWREEQLDSMNWPTKVWRSEAAIQLGLRPKLRVRKTDDVPGQSIMDFMGVAK